MKHTPLTKLLAIGAVSALALSASFAQTTKETTTTTTAGDVTASTTKTTTLDGTGVITTYTPGQEYITMKTETSTSPVKYYYSKNTTIVDPTGATVEWSALRPEMPVRYTYVREGDRMVISKITLQKPIATYTKETTTTTTTEK